MKRVLILTLTLVMLLTLCSCDNGNKKAFNAADSAFNNIDNAYGLIENFGSDIYEAWRLGIYEDDDISVKLLADELSISEQDINAAIDDICGMDNVGDLYFSVFKDELFSACVIMVSRAYELNGTSDKINSYLTDAKLLMKEMSEKYSDYEHYSNLKGYYTTTNAFFEFCQNPTGSFRQVQDTINSYRNDARNYRNDLAYIFDD